MIGRAYSVKRRLLNKWAGGTLYNYGIGPANYPVPATIKPLLTETVTIHWRDKWCAVWAETDDYPNGYWKQMPFPF